MEVIIGDKSSFAIQLEIVKSFPVWGKFALWLCRSRIGNYESNDYLHSSIHTLGQLALDYGDFWDDELNGLGSTEIFSKINPFYQNPDAFYDLSYEEQGDYTKYDKYILSWGSNFNRVSPNVVIRDRKCQFIWAELELNSDGQYSPIEESDLQCCIVPLEEVQYVYKRICELLPEANYPLPDV